MELCRCWLSLIKAFLLEGSTENNLSIFWSQPSLCEKEQKRYLSTNFIMHISGVLGQQTSSKAGRVAWYCGLHQHLPQQGFAVQILRNASLSVLFFVFLINCMCWKIMNKSPSHFTKKYQNLVISKFRKSQNKVAVAEEIGCGNDIVLSKIGQKMYCGKKK